jgi:HEAT repeat protein
MVEWVVYGLYILGSSGFMLYSHRQLRRRQRVLLETFQEAAKLCGLRVVSITDPGSTPLRLEAQADEATVRVEDIPGKGREFSTRVVVTFPGPPGFSGVRIRPEAQRPAGAREIEVGDGRFDSMFFVEGPARLLTLLLDAETRHLLAGAHAAGRLTIAGGEICVETFDSLLASLLPTLLDLARRFSSEVDVARRLAENARQDSTAGVRLRNLLTLAREFPREPETIETLRAACADASPQVRLRAAMALGAERHDVLTEVAASLEDDESSAQAVAHLGRELPFERCLALLDQALRRHRIRTARACLEALGRNGNAAAAEPPLLLALQHEEMDIRIAAASALGRVGSAAAVLPLKEAAQGSPELRRATRQAIAEIQSRLQGASPGQLSLTGNEAGQLSMADAEAGQLSLATDPAGQLSLPQTPGEQQT